MAIAFASEREGGGGWAVLQDDGSDAGIWVGLERCEVADHAAAVSDEAVAAVVMDSQAVAVTAGGVGDRVSSGHPRERALAQQSPARGIAAAQEQASENAHVLRRRRDRAVGGIVLEPRPGREWGAAVPHPIVAQVLIADGEAGAHVIRDGGLGRGHPERPEDPLAKEFAVGPALDRIDDQAEGLVADV